MALRRFNERIMSEERLAAIEIETAHAPDASVIWMHGLGDDGRGWSEVVPTLQLPASLRVRFVFPHAPVMPVTINQGMSMRAWYDVRAANITERADLDGVRRSEQQVGALIEHEASRGISPARIVLAGFSQGGAIALFAGLRYPQRIAGIVALSTYLIAPDLLADDASSANRDVPIFMAHGTRDPVVQFPWGETSRRALEAGGWSVEWHAYPMEHSAVIEEIVEVGRFLVRVLGSGSA
jgi:phospholipase/carboxylesterase